MSKKFNAIRNKENIYPVDNLNYLQQKKVS